VSVTSGSSIELAGGFELVFGMEASVDLSNNEILVSTKGTSQELYSKL